MDTIIKVYLKIKIKKEMAVPPPNRIIKMSLFVCR